MSSASLPVVIDHTQHAIALASAEIDPKILETVIVGGDLSKLTPAQRVAWYRARCEAAGLDPRTQPFQYLVLQGKTTLYATKTASDQLAGLHRLSVEIRSREFDEETGILTVHCRATFPDGHFTDDQGSLFVGKLQGEPRANAYMKACSKAKRRTILSATGLGMLDDTEVDSIPDARRMAQDEAYAAPDAHHAKYLENNTGHGSGAYAAPATVDAYRDWVKTKCEEANGKWSDKWTDRETGELDSRVLTWKNGELINSWQLSGHIVKWARSEGLIQAPENYKPAQCDKLAAVAWDRFSERVHAETRDYLRKEWVAISAKIQMPKAERPAPVEAEDLSQEVDDQLDGVEDAWEPGRE